MKNTQVIWHQPFPVAHGTWRWSCWAKTARCRWLEGRQTAPSLESPAPEHAAPSPCLSVLRTQRTESRCLCLECQRTWSRCGWYSARDRSPHLAPGLWWSAECWGEAGVDRWCTTHAPSEDPGYCPSDKTGQHPWSCVKYQTASSLRTWSWDSWEWWRSGPPWFRKEVTWRSPSPLSLTPQKEVQGGVCSSQSSLSL